MTRIICIDPPSVPPKAEPKKATENDFLLEVNEMRDQYRDIERRFNREKGEMTNALQSALPHLRRAAVDQMVYAIVDYAMPVLPNKAIERGYRQLCNDIMAQIETIPTPFEDRYLNERETGYLVRAAVADVFTSAELMKLERDMSKEWRTQRMNFTIRCD